MKAPLRLLLPASLLLLATTTAASQPDLILSPPTHPASIPHASNFTSLSIEPAYWYDFVGSPSSPNPLFFSLLSTMHSHGANPTIRPGGITQDSMTYSSASTHVALRTTNAQGGVYRTTLGPAFYRTWSLFPPATRFVSTLNLGNDSLLTAEALALASWTMQRGRIAYFELGNEPTNYPASRWHRRTGAYVRQWRDWTERMDRLLGGGKRRWWASSATTDSTGLAVRPSDLIPAGIDAAHQVGAYSLHSYPFSSCTPAHAADATIGQLLNHTRLVRYADRELLPSARAAAAAGTPWLVGETNSVACSGRAGVTDRFAQALWTADTHLLYAARNASAVFLHQGATLPFQSARQTARPDPQGRPAYSAYNLLYPRESAKWGAPRVSPAFVALLLVAEAVRDGRVAPLDVPEGGSVSAYAVYTAEGELVRIALLNLAPFYPRRNGAHELGVTVDLGRLVPAERRMEVKRMTAPSVDEADAQRVTWAGQSFEQGRPEGKVEVETVRGGTVRVRGSEAVLVFVGGVQDGSSSA